MHVSFALLLVEFGDQGMHFVANLRRLAFPLRFLFLELFQLTALEHNQCVVGPDIREERLQTVIVLV